MGYQIEVECLLTAHLLRVLEGLCHLGVEADHQVPFLGADFVAQVNLSTDPIGKGLLQNRVKDVH